MASFLYRLGRLAFRRRWLVAGLWVAVLMAALAGAATLSGATSDAFRIPGTPSQQAIDLLQERFRSPPPRAPPRGWGAAPPNPAVAELVGRIWSQYPGQQVAS